MHIEAHFLGGENISNACREAIALANRVGCDVHFKFNDVKCMAFVGGRADDLEASWHAEANSSKTYKIATSRPRPDHETPVSQCHAEGYTNTRAIGGDFCPTHETSHATKPTSCAGDATKDCYDHDDFNYCWNCKTTRAQRYTLKTEGSKS